MRIRRRPRPSDPSTSTAPQTPKNAPRSQECLEEGTTRQQHAGVDLGKKSGAARRLALPLVDNADVCGANSLGAEQGGDGIHRSMVNGHRGGTDREDDVTCTGGIGIMSEWAAKAEGPVRNGAAAPLISAVKEETNGGDGCGGAKKRRAPAVLMEGSRCSRVNGRGWRCSQPTLVGYSLCEHHLGKGRMRTAAAAAGQLGRTEHRRPMVPAAPGAVTMAEEPSLGGRI